MSLVRVERFRKGALDGPASLEPLVDGKARDASFTRPGHQRERAAPKRKPVDVSLVVGLLENGGPSAVTRLVTAVVVDTLKRESGWTWTHVREEGREILHPQIAHHDATAAVVSKFSPAAVSATPPHSQPRTVFSGPAAPMGSVPGGGQLGVKATTASGAPIGESGPVNLLGGPAGTPAQPTSLAGSGGLRNYGPATKSSSGERRRLIHAAEHSTSLINRCE